MADITAIIDYGSGNLRSASKAFERVASEAGAGQKIVVTSDPETVRGAVRIVLPGVGAFADCRAGLLAISGMMDALSEAVIDRGRPFLGICVGMQLMATRGLEHGAHDGFDWIPGDVSAIAPTGGLKVPHMGWNELSLRAADHPLLAGIGEGRHAYFVHSYQLRAENPAHVLAMVDYGGTVTAMVGRDNLVGTQFHPEKSQAMGLHLIANFLTWKP
jgi:imidazole glycerol-phosphate synthase subunit HisH